MTVMVLVCGLRQGRAAFHSTFFYLAAVKMPRDVRGPNDKGSRKRCLIW
jgi:hypothetical protein